MSGVTDTREAARTSTFDTVVLESVVETASTRTLVLDVVTPGVDHTAWRAGQYISIDPHQFPGLRNFVHYLEHAKKRHEPPRAYSMSSAPHEPYLAVTVKEEVFEPGRTAYPPLMSGFLVHDVRAGDRMEVRGFAGAYVLPENIEARTEHVLHLVAGSGSVPNLSMVKDSLLRHARLRHTFAYSNRTWDDVIFRDLLAELAEQHPDRLTVLHNLTRDPDAASYGPNVRSGRIDAAFLRALLAREPTSLVYACGPAVSVWERRACTAEGRVPSPQFLESMIAQLHEIGVPKDRIKLEAFG